MKKIKVALCGTSGHQIHEAMRQHSYGEVVAICDFEKSKIPPHLQHVPCCDSLETLLKTIDCDFVSICSARRDEQIKSILLSLKAGKHTYAEKPAVTTEADLDTLLACVRENKVIFHEMGAYVLPQPYALMHRMVSDGLLGDIVQVFSQKSYPWKDWRPHDEGIDGGLAMQVGIYNARFIEHVTGETIASMETMETQRGNDIPNSACRRAVSMIYRLQNGGIASAVANYLCPSTWNKWGYENLRIFGTKGFLESINSGEILRLALEGQEVRDIQEQAFVESELNVFLNDVQEGKAQGMESLDRELSPTRWVIRSKKVRCR